MTCVGDWMKLNCGDRVREHEGRHVGRVEAIHNSATVKVKWEDTGWISELPLGDLVKVDTRIDRVEDWEEVLTGLYEYDQARQLAKLIKRLVGSEVQLRQVRRSNETLREDSYRYRVVLVD